MWTLALACAFFLCIHLISGTTVKERIVARIGTPAWLILFSLLSLIALIWMSVAFAVALNNQDGLNVVLWSAPLPLRVIALFLNFIAFQLVIVGYFTPSPTGIRALWGLPEKPVQGIVRVSRHPIMAGIALWALVHIICNGNLAAWLFFGTLLAQATLGAINIDRKRLVAYGDEYVSIMKRTSIIPFVAIIEGRTAFVPEELGYARMFLAASMFAVFTVLHELLFVVRAL